MLNTNELRLLQKNGKQTGPQTCLLINILISIVDNAALISYSLGNRYENGTIYNHHAQRGTYLMDTYVVGVDNGGTFIKAAVYDDTGRMVTWPESLDLSSIPHQAGWSAIPNNCGAPTAPAFAKQSAKAASTLSK